MHVWVKALLSVLCAAASALFSGLILGFMSLDILQLQLLTYVEPVTKQDQIYSRYARRILPLRRDANLLLSTLILSNSMVNALMVLMLGDMLDMTWGFVVSTLVTALLGEIAPQSVFMKHALMLCGFFSAPLKILVVILYPACKPLALFLDFILGPSSQVVYTRQQLKALVDLQLEKGNVLTHQEAKMLKGCLELSSIRAEDVMTPLDSIVHIKDGTVATKDVIHQIALSGFSNIPIVTNDAERSVIGFIVAKDLMLFDSNKTYRVKDLFDTIGKAIYAVDAENDLIDLLTLFKTNSRHVLVVRKAIIPDTGGDPVYKHIGIITVGDILRVMLHDYNDDKERRISAKGDVIAYKNDIQAKKHACISQLVPVNHFSLNSIKAIFPMEQPKQVLRALNVTDCPKNIEIIQTKHIFLVEKNTVIPSGCIYVILKGEVSYLEEEKPLGLELPFALESGKIERKLVTRTACEIVEIPLNEDFTR